MTHPDVTKQSPGDATRTRPVRRSWQQRPPVDIDAAYDVCEQITRAQARDRYTAIESLPAYRRRALCAIYAFAQRVEDTVHADLRPAVKLRLLADARAGIPRVGTPRPTDPVLVALRDVNRRFPIPLGSLDDLIDGGESDVLGVAHDTFEDLVHYCRQVSGSIWRMSVAVLGSRDPAAAAELADDLGVAIQLTKLLRDRVRDFQRGRVDLPPEDFDRLIRHHARLSRDWHDRGLRLLPLLDARGAACVEAAAGMNIRILERIERSATDLPRISPHAPVTAQITASAYRAA